MHQVLIALALSVATTFSAAAAAPVELVPAEVVEQATTAPVLTPFVEVALPEGDPSQHVSELPIVDTRWGPMNCPVNGPHHFVSSWGFARSGGRRHQGNDIMAARHTPVVAVTNGVIHRVDRSDRRGDLGGRTVWLESDAGVRFYYAHLESVTDGLARGQRVVAGAELGTVGTSGNARGGAPHLHFEIRPGGRPIDPYPTLSEVCRGAQ